MKKIIPSCSMCQNFDPLRYKCKISNEAVEADNTQLATQCETEGRFIRDLNVLPDSINLYANPNLVPFGWQPDLSKVSKDEEGRPLYLITSRGYERALPAYAGIKVEYDTYMGKVNRCTTYQGQRQMVYELGYELAKKVIEAEGYELHTLPGEEEYQGLEKHKRHFMVKQLPNKKQVLLADEPIEVWE